MTEQMSANPEEVDRRKFLTGIIGVVAGAVAVVVGVPTIGYLISPGVKQANAEKWITLGPINSLTPGVPIGFPFSRSIIDGWVESYPVRRRLCADVRRAERPGPVGRVHASELPCDLADGSAASTCVPATTAFSTLPARSCPGRRRSR